MTKFLEMPGFFEMTASVDVTASVEMIVSVLIRFPREVSVAVTGEIVSGPKARAQLTPGSCLTQAKMGVAWATVQQEKPGERTRTIRAIRRQMRPERDSRFLRSGRDDKVLGNDRVFRELQRLKLETFSAIYSMPEGIP